MSRSARVIRFLLCAVVLCAAGRTVHAGGDNSWTVYAPDPEAYAKAWTNIVWASRVNRALVWGGNSHNYRGNNSVRAFDPASNTWEILYPNNGGTAGVQNRDNHGLFYVPTRGAMGELWVIGGAYTSGYPCPEQGDQRCPKGTNFGGRFDLESRRWVNIAHSSAEFGAGLIRGHGEMSGRRVITFAQGWCDALNAGVMYGGSGSTLLELIAPNPAGPEPYRFWRGSPPGGPGPRSQIQNNGTCAGEHFYLYGGRISKPGQDLRDLWRLHVPSRTWAQLAPAPQALYRPVLTYDGANKVLVLHGGSSTRNVYVYHIDSKTWEDMTPTMRLAGDRPWPNGGRMGVYAPSVNQHIYTGGGVVGPDGSRDWRNAVQVDGYSYRAQPPRNARHLPLALGGFLQQTWAALFGGVAEAAEGPGPPTQISIPPNTWIARPLPEPGKGVRGGKHLRIAHHPPDGRLYFLGGDYSGPGGVQSGRNELYSYSVKDDQWRLEWPYCGPPGTIQPSHPDQVGWVYDSHRKLFWMLPGYMGVDVGRCQEAGSQLIRSRIMTFDPATRLWALLQIENPYRIPGHQKLAQYDPVTDTVIVFSWQAPPEVAILNLKQKTWSVKRFTGRAQLGKEYSAFDPERRVIYVVEPREAKLYRYAIGTQELAAVAPAPRGSVYDRTMLVWDSVNRVLLFPQYLETSDVRLHVYHPDTNTWEMNLPIHQPEGYRVRGTNAVFDPYQNVLLILGQKGGEPDTNPYLFLYRYRNGAGGR